MENNQSINYKIETKSINKAERLGAMFKTNEGCICEVVGYVGAKEVYVKFNDEHGYVAKCEWGQLCKGQVKNPFFPSVHGVGYIGEGNAIVSMDNKSTREYQLWNGVIERCYSAKFHERRPTYKGVTVCERWHNFNTFCEDIKQLVGYEEWLLNDGEYALDKDAICEYYQIPKVYSPITCVFLSQADNTRIAHLNNKHERMEIISKYVA